MKKIIFLLITILSISNLLSQPEYFNFQAVLRDIDNKLVVDKPVSLRISLLKNSDVGTILYRETHNILTNSNGIATIQIGSGNSDIGNYFNIEWTKDNVYVKVELDINNSGQYTIVGTTQLLAVPYALFAKYSNGSVDYIAGDGIKIENNIVSNIKPNQEVNIIGIDGIKVSGNYPNFVISDTGKVGYNSEYYAGIGIEIKNDTISNTLPNKTLLLNGSNGIQISGSYPEYTIGLLANNSAWHPFDSTNFLIKGADNVSLSLDDTNFNVKGARVMWIGNKAAFRAGWTLLSNDNTNEIDTTTWDYNNVGIYSAAFGNSNLAAGTQSFATGKYNKLYGENSFASGYLNTVNSKNGAVFGEKNEVSAENSIAIGNRNLVKGVNALILGFENVTTHPNSINSGYQNLCEGSNSMLVGSASIVMADNSASIGYSNFVSGESSIAIGSQNRATRGASIAMGLSTVASGFNSVAIGSGVVASGERSVAVGTTANTNNKTGAFVFTDGNVGDVLATSENQMTMRFIGGYTLFTNIGLTLGAILNPNSSSWATISDSTKKENFIKADGKYFLEQISELNLGSWNYRGVDKNNRHYGAFAQEIFSAFGKDTIGTIGNDTTITTTDMDGIMLIGIQALIEENKQQQEEINSLKIKLEFLLEELKQIKEK